MDEAAELELNGFGSPGQILPVRVTGHPPNLLWQRIILAIPASTLKCDIVGRNVTADPGYLIVEITNEVSDVGLHRH